MVQFKVELLRLLVGYLYDIDALILCASWFGWPVRRRRLYVVMTLKGAVRLRRPLQELMSTLGLPWTAARASDLLVGDFPVQKLTVAQRRVFNEYVAGGKHPGRDVFYDPTQYPSANRGRSAPGRGVLFTLTANTSKDETPYKIMNALIVFQ